MTQADLFNMVANIKGAPFAHITYNSVVKVPKKYGISGVVTKVVSTQVKVNFPYEKVVKDHIKAQGGDPSTFNGESTNKGVWELANKVIFNASKGCRYLRYYCVKNQAKETNYFVNGIKATDAELAIIKTYEQTLHKPSPKQTASGLQAKDQVMPRDVLFDNIMEFACGGKRWTADVQPTKGAA